MSNKNLPPIEDKAEMIDWIAAGCKPVAAWLIGTEHEKIGFDLSSLKPLPYDGDTGIFAMLEGLKKFDWEGVVENGYLIALKRGGASVSLEPGGQFELSGAPLKTIHQTCGEVNQHLREVKEIADKIGAGFLSLGFRPDTKLEDVPVMPKARYDIMRAYMPTVGTHGLEMMLRTCTVQVNLDFASEADMVKKMRVSPCNRLPLRCSPILRLRTVYQTAIIPTGLASGSTRTPIEQVCYHLHLKRGSDLSNMWIMPWMCPCTLFIVERIIWMHQVKVSVIFWTENWIYYRAKNQA